MHTTTRRTFVKNASLAALSVGILGCGDSQQSSESATTSLTPEPSISLPKIGLQLWTVRDLIEKDLAGTLAQVAEIGFGGVETAFWPEGVSLEQGAKALETAGLSVFAIHVELPLGENKALFTEMADAYHCKRLVWHGWPEDERYKTLGGTQELAKIYEDAAALAKEHGLSFGLHNHWWEFEKMEDADMMPFDWLLANLSEEIFFELDTYWAKVAGSDPAQLMKKWGKRAPLLHIKDGPAKHDEPMLAVGKGVQDFPAIAKAGEGAIEWMIVEMDECATDMMTAVKESHAYLVEQGLGA
ncbi:MAG: sugar phosphate isomerase/epimerase [Bacteroidota bacterium]